MGTTGFKFGPMWIETAAATERLNLLDAGSLLTESQKHRSHQTPFTESVILSSTLPTITDRGSLRLIHRVRCENILRSFSDVLLRLSHATLS